MIESGKSLSEDKKGMGQDGKCYTPEEIARKEHDKEKADLIIRALSQARTLKGILFLKRKKKKEKRKKNFSFNHKVIKGLFFTNRDYRTKASGNGYAH